MRYVMVVVKITDDKDPYDVAKAMEIATDSDLIEYDVSDADNQIWLYGGNRIDESITQ